jgi:hypothetical protein
MGAHETIDHYKNEEDEDECNTGEYQLLFASHHHLATFLKKIPSNLYPFSQS